MASGLFMVMVQIPFCVLVNTASLAILSPSFFHFYLKCFNIKTIEISRNNKRLINNPDGNTTCNLSDLTRTFWEK